MKHVLAGMILALAWTTSAPAYQAKSNPATAAPATAKAAATPKLSAEDQAKKQELLDSERFLELNIAFEDWLSVQNFYKAEQIPRLRADVRRKIEAMTPRELEMFIRQSEAKLAILMSPEAVDARNWLGHFVSAKAVLPASEVDQWDVLKMTPAQIEQALRRVEARRASRASANRAFNTAREASVQNARSTQNQQRAESARQRAQTTGGGSPFAAPTRPAPRQVPERPRPRMILGPGGPGFIF
jgi:hypothetical protein